MEWDNCFDCPDFGGISYLQYKEEPTEALAHCNKIPEDGLVTKEQVENKQIDIPDWCPLKKTAEVNMTEQQKKAVNKLRSAVRAMDKAGLTCFYEGDGGDLEIFIGSIPRHGDLALQAGQVDLDQAVASVETHGWDGGGA